MDCLNSYISKNFDGAFVMGFPACRKIFESFEVAFFNSAEQMNRHMSYPSIDRDPACRHFGFDATAEPSR
jgi:hypothetical protein